MIIEKKNEEQPVGGKDCEQNKGQGKGERR
jgi:hypothetical protein